MRFFRKVRLSLKRAIKKHHRYIEQYVLLSKEEAIRNSTAGTHAKIREKKLFQKKQHFPSKFPVTCISSSINYKYIKIMKLTIEKDGYLINSFITKLYHRKSKKETRFLKKFISKDFFTIIF